MLGCGTEAGWLGGVRLSGICCPFPCGAGTAGDAGIGTGAGAVFAGTGALLFTGADSKTVVPNPAFRVARMESESEVTMNKIAEIVVALESSVAEPRGPKAVCDPIPPNAPARSAAFPLCRSTTMIRNRHTIT